MFIQEEISKVNVEIDGKVVTSFLDELSQVVETDGHVILKNTKERCY